MYTYTESQLKAWKKKYGEKHVFEIVVEDKKCLLHKPTRQDLSYATAGSNQGKDSAKFVELLAKQCWIDGNREIIDDDDYFLSLAPVMEAMVETKKAEIKKL